MSENPAAAVLGDSGITRLRSFIERIERLEEEKKGLQDDIKEVYAEAKGTGFDPKYMRIIVKLRKMDKSEIQEQDEMIEVYRLALGLVPDGSSASGDE